MWCDCRAQPSDLVYSENRSGPNTEPWGTPVSRKQGFDKEPFHVTWKVQLFRYDMNQVRAESLMPSSARVGRRIWRLTVSNAEDKSKTSPIHTAVWMQGSCANSPPLCEISLSHWYTSGGSFRGAALANRTKVVYSIQFKGLYWQESFDHNIGKSILSKHLDIKIV